MGIMAPLIVAAGLAMSQVEAFMGAAFMNYYAIVALVLLWLVALAGVDFGPMRKAEELAADGEGLLPAGDKPLGQLSDDIPSHEPGSIHALLFPFISLIVGVAAGMYITGGLTAGDWGITATLAEDTEDLAGDREHKGLPLGFLGGLGPGPRADQFGQPRFVDLLNAHRVSLPCSVCRRTLQ